MGIYFPSTFAEWTQDMKAGLDAGVEAAKGVGDTAQAIVTFPHNSLAYLTGTDASFGEGNSLFSSKFGQHYRRSDAVTVAAENPVYRAADVAGHMAYGLVDLVGLHIPHQIFNEKLGLNIPYFQPVPEDARGIGRDAGMMLFIGALPAARARVQRALEVVPKPRPVVPDPVRAQRAPSEGPAVGLAPLPLGIWANVAAWMGRMQYRWGRLLSERISSLEERAMNARGGTDALEAIRELVELSEGHGVRWAGEILDRVAHDSLTRARLQRVLENGIDHNLGFHLRLYLTYFKLSANMRVPLITKVRRTPWMVSVLHRAAAEGVNQAASLLREAGQDITALRSLAVRDATAFEALDILARDYGIQEAVAAIRDMPMNYHFHEWVSNRVESGRVRLPHEDPVSSFLSEQHTQRADQHHSALHRAAEYGNVKARQFLGLDEQKPASGH